MISHIPEAISLRNATKKYGENKPILDGLNMTVTRGSIYGLLGASGCGKTTLLSCIVGIQKLNSGEICVLGGNPGSKNSSIPGPKVGFMPQEISLVKEFTVMDALNYFGRINYLDAQVINERYYFLSNLLQLPPKNHYVKNMSGGQQRRVSLACALIHEPELLILDEPTVGLDPILRENIWNFLVSLIKRNMTIVITTHYIDEAKLADKIGLLRHGKLLAESSPNKLLIKCRCDSLEEAFLRLSQKQQDSEVSGEIQLTNSENNVEYLPELVEITNSIATPSTTAMTMASTITTTTTSTIADENFNIPNFDRYNSNLSRTNNSMSHSEMRRACRRFQALLIKNFFQFIRHPGGIIFAFIFPFIQANLLFTTIGGDPRNLSIAIVNEEAGNCQAGTYIGEVIYSSDDYVCDFVNLSCRFLNDFHEKIPKNVFYNDENDAIKSVERGETVGLIYFGRNFSHTLQERLNNFDIDNISSGEIKVRLDMGNRQIGLFVQKYLYEKFFHTYKHIIQECKLSKKLGDFPLRLKDPIYGSIDETFTTFVAPAFILSLIFFLSTSVSSAIIISDRSEGVWNRSLVQGVTTIEILIAHILTQLTLIVIQVTVATTVVFVQYNFECRGSLFASIILIFLTGVCGMSYGFLVSVMCTSHTFANYITTGSFYPVILLCGCIWPLEGMPKFLRWFSLLLPITIPSLSLRSILIKGHDINNPEVYQGFITLVGWILFFFLLCVIGLRRK